VNPLANDAEIDYMTADGRIIRENPPKFPLAFLEKG
jgi:hypothetical protein